MQGLVGLVHYPMQKVDLACVDARGVLNFECGVGELGNACRVVAVVVVTIIVIIIVLIERRFVMQIFLEVGLNVNIEIAGEVT